MKILIVGSGGREHALAWAMRDYQVVVIPGNGGTGTYDVKDKSFLDCALIEKPDLTIVGPEKPLADGIVDEFTQNNLKIYGPTKSAARLESSKSFAKDFMQSNNIPCAKGKTFSSYSSAASYLQSSGHRVIKADGLAGGKGVVVANSLREAEIALYQIMVEKLFGNAGDEVVIEERLVGQEISALAFCDGNTFKLMPLSRDYKRLLNGHKGPHTGGMGAYCPVENNLNLDIFFSRVQNYTGVLYAGLILTKEGPKILEYNCRFGDPEAQVILPLLETNLLEIIDASLEGRLSDLEIKWSNRTAVGVVLASNGYPADYQTGFPIEIKENSDLIFHAGTDEKGMTKGGRVLTVVGIASTKRQAIHRAYSAIKNIYFENMYYREDIGQ